VADRYLSMYHRGEVNRDNARVQPPLALEFTTTVLLIIAIASIAVLVLIVVAPWRRVREEPPLDRDVETRILLHRPNPEEETGEMPTARVTDLNDFDRHEKADFADLRDLDER
jgi:hypothetical protein